MGTNGLGTPLAFRYANAAGEESVRALLRWSESGHYLKGYDASCGRVMTFRKDRIREYLDGCAALLSVPHSPPPPAVVRSAPADQRPQVVFTGFPRIQRAHLEQKADESGMAVVGSVTVKLAFLVYGPNAGPAKIEKAMSQGVYIVSEPEFHELAETGVLPDRLADRDLTDC